MIERLEGDRFYNAAHAGAQMKGLVGLPLPLTRQFPGGRAVLDRQRVIIDDIQLVAETEYPDTLELLKLNTVHSVRGDPAPEQGEAAGQPGRPARRGAPLHGRGGRPARDVRRPGSDRDRERAPVQGAGGAQRGPFGVAGSADGDGGDPARDQWLADGRSAGLRRHRPERGAPVRCAQRRDLSARAGPPANGVLRRDHVARMGGGVAELCGAAPP